MLVWSELFWPDIGGVEVLLMQYLRELRQRGVDCRVLCSRTGLQTAEGDVFHGVPVYRFPFQRMLVGGDLRAMLAVTAEVKRILEEWPPDLVHLHTSGTSLFFVEQGRVLEAAPSIATLHSPLPAEMPDDGLLNRILARVNWVTAVSEATLRRAREVFPHLAGKSSVILNALPEGIRSPQPLSCHPPRLLCLGRMVPVKGFDVALRAFPMIRQAHPEARLICSGDGPERPGLEALARALGIEEAVQFTSWIPPEMVPRLIDSVSVVLMPSRYEEPFGLVAVQAAQGARPIVASRAGGLSEVVVDGVTGMLVPPEDPEALAAATLQLLGDPAGAARLGLQARAHAAETFGFARMVSQYQQLYGRIVKPGIMPACE